MKGKIASILFSTRLTAVLFVLFPTAMGIGTFIESWYSTDTAKIWIYNACLISSAIFLNTDCFEKKNGQSYCFIYHLSL